MLIVDYRLSGLAQPADCLLDGINAPSQSFALFAEADGGVGSLCLPGRAAASALTEWP
jgi:hypothetical protein